MYGYIYCTTNLVNGIKYIGQKKSDRFLGNRYLGSGRLIGRAFKKSGNDRSKFEVELIEECSSQDELDSREIYWISKYRSDNIPLYNIADGGNGGNMVRNLSKEKYDEWIHNLSISHIGKSNGPKSDEFKQAMSKRFKGKPLSEEHKQKLKDNHVGTTGKKYSEESRARMREARARLKAEGYRSPNLGKHLSDEHKFKLSVSNKNKEHNISEDGRRRLSENDPCYNKKCINNGKICKYVSLQDIDFYLNQGWKLGRIIRKGGDSEYGQ